MLRVHTLHSTMAMQPGQWIASCVVNEEALQKLVSL